MQDNFKHNEDLEAAFLNDSWDKMSAMLDTEMPAIAPKEERNYRSLVALLLLLLVAGGALYSTLRESDDLAKAIATLDNTEADQLTQKGDKQMTAEQNAFAKVEQAIVEEPQTAAADFSNNSKKTENLSQSNNTITNDNLSTTTVLSNNALTKSNIVSATAKKDKSNLVHLSESQQKTASVIASAKLYAEPPSFVRFYSTNAQNLASRSINTEKNSAIISETKKAESFLLPTKSHPLLEEKEAIQTAVLIKPIQSKPKVQFGIIAGLQQEKFNLGFGGFHVGGLVSRNLANDFTLEAGLTFSATQFNNTKADYAPPAITFDQPSEPNLSGIEESLTITYAPSDAEAQDFVQLGTAYWLSLPVQLTYQPLPKWRVNMGVEYAHLLRANQQKLVGNTNEKSGSVTDLVAHNSISALTGLTWFPQKNFGIDIRYQFGFTDLFKANSDFVDQTDTRSALQWSLVYYFNR